MNFISKIPGLRILARLYEYIHRSAPLEEFVDYDEYWMSRVDDGQVIKELDRFRVVSRLIHDGESVLDIGCGDCSFQRYLRTVSPNCQSLGVDTSLKAVTLAQGMGINAKQINKDSRLNEQIKRGWDVITLMEVIEHIPDAEELMRQVIELQPKRIFITIPNVGCLKHRLRLMFGGRFPITSIYYHMKEHVRFWTTKDFMQWAHSFGLIVENIYGQFDHGDKFVEWSVRKHPELFADRIIYELKVGS